MAAVLQTPKPRDACRQSVNRGCESRLFASFLCVDRTSEPLIVFAVLLESALTLCCLSVLLIISYIILHHAESSHKAESQREVCLGYFGSLQYYALVWRRKLRFDQQCPLRGTEPKATAIASLGPGTPKPKRARLHRLDNVSTQYNGCSVQRVAKPLDSWPHPLH